MVAARQEQPAVNIKALAWTISVHVLLLLIFFLWQFNVLQKAVVETGGLEVNLGTSDNGSGTDQPMSTEDPSAYKAAVVYKDMSRTGSLPKDMLQSNEENAPTINKNTTKKKDNQQTTDKGKAQEQPRYVYAGANGKGGNGAVQNMKGTNEGNTTGPGDRGVPNGTPGATNYTGTPGNGMGGMSSTLSGRHISPDKFEAEFHEGGKVVIHVTVAKNGTITDMQVKSSSGRELTQIALDKLRKAKFSSNTDPGAPPEQFGDVTIYFKTRS